MKITRLNRTAPAPILEWIEEELENRGIDAVVYTKYILSLLQDEDNESDEFNVKDHNFPLNAFCEYHSNVKNRSNVNENIKPSTGKWRHKRYANVKSSNKFSNIENINQNCYYCWNDLGKLKTNESKKLTVIEILKSATEQEIGIESFVDELYGKLKNFKANLSSESDNEEIIDSEKENQFENNQISPLEQAQKYFAAFPALGSSQENINSKKDIMIEMKKKQEKNKDWDGRRIVKFNENNDDSSARQTTNSASTYLFNNNYNNNNTLITGSDMGRENLIQIPDHFDYMVIKDTPHVNYVESDLVNLHFENIQKISNTDDFETFQKLVDKFNSNIASIWTNSNSNSKSNNIWSFDSSFSSSQSSATSSPKLNEKNKEFLHNDNFVVDEIVSNLSTNSQIIWGSLTPMNNLSLNNDGYENKQRTSLSNHKKDSLFVELSPKLHSSSEPVFSHHFLSSNNNNNNNATTTANSTITINSNNYSIIQDSDAKGNIQITENLLISPKTHFQPIKQDSLERESDDGSVMDADAEVASLTICSSKCPNIKNPMTHPNYQSDVRAVSTSLEELSSFMGPFNEEISDDKCYASNNKKIFDLFTASDNYKDKSTNTDVCRAREIKEIKEIKQNKQMKQVESSHTIYDIDTEPEYQDLCNMLNEVLKNGIKDDSLCDNTGQNFFSDWLEEDKLTGSKDEKHQNRLSWNCYWDTFADNSEINKENFLSYHQQEIMNEYDKANYDDLVNFYNENEDFNQLYSNGDQEWFNKDELNYMTSCIENSTNYQLSEPDWHESEIQGQNHTLLQMKMKMKMKNSEVSQKFEKPCSYFLEGNCMRSDCKYSHDIANITCKFWQEGFCFKESLCPFLHGYSNDSYKTGSNNKQNPSFTIESEADFPTLNENYYEIDQHNTGLNTSVNTCINTGVKNKMPIVTFIKKKGKKRKDRTFQ